MRRLKPCLFAVALLGVWLSASSSEPAYDPYGGYTPYFMERSDLEQSVGYIVGAREMVNPGKIWVSGDGATIYIVERYKGVHVIDNTNRSAPEPKGFITAPGCMDVAIKGDIIYLDNAVDLVAFSLTSNRVTKRLKEYFPEPLSPNGISYRNYYYSYNSADMGNKILVGWRKK